jgi:hypothetical protein
LQAHLNRTVCRSVADPDVFRPPRSSYHQANILRKTLIPPVFGLLFDFDPDPYQSKISRIYKTLVCRAVAPDQENFFRLGGFKSGFTEVPVTV